MTDPRAQLHEDLVELSKESHRMPTPAELAATMAEAARTVSLYTQAIDACARIVFSVEVFHLLGPPARDEALAALARLSEAGEPMPPDLVEMIEARLTEST